MNLDSWGNNHSVQLVLWTVFINGLVSKRKRLWQIIRRTPKSWHSLRRQGWMNLLLHLERAWREPNYALRCIVQDTAALGVSFTISATLILLPILRWNALHLGEARLAPGTNVQIWAVSQEVALALFFLCVVAVALFSQAFASAYVVRSARRRAKDLRWRLGILSREEQSRWDGVWEDLGVSEDGRPD